MKDCIFIQFFHTVTRGTGQVWSSFVVRKMQFLWNKGRILEIGCMDDLTWNCFAMSRDFHLQNEQNENKMKINENNGKQSV